MKKTLVAFLFVPAMANAEFMSGNQLLRDLTDGSQMNEMLAIGYIMGVSDTFTNATVCPPAGVTAGQVQDIVKKHLIANPAIRHFTADSIIRNKLEDIWPCRRGKGA